MHDDEATQRELLTFVTAGGGFSGAETTGAVNDFLRETARFYPAVKPELIRTVLVHGGEHLLPELGKELGRYAERKLRKRGVVVINDALVTSYDGLVAKAKRWHIDLCCDTYLDRRREAKSVIDKLAMPEGPRPDFGG